MHLQAGQ
nr:unnamed protein product [Timema poppensis]